MKKCYNITKDYLAIFKCQQIMNILSAFQQFILQEISDYLANPKAILPQHFSCSQAGN